MLLHVRVTPHPDEPLTIDHATADAAYNWLIAQWEYGTIIDEPRALKKTGGYMNVRVVSHTWEAALAELDAWLGTYPLRDTITVEVDELAPTLADGFAVLHQAIDEQRRIAP